MLIVARVDRGINRARPQFRELSRARRCVSDGQSDRDDREGVLCIGKISRIVTGMAA